MRLDNVCLLVTKFDECLRFYRDILGLELAWGEEGGRYASFATENGQGISLYRRELMAEVVHTTDLPEHVEVQDRFACVIEVANLEQTVEEIERRGGSFITPIHDRPEWGIRVAHLRDPDGNLIELYTNLAKEKWDPALVELSKKYSE